MKVSAVCVKLITLIYSSLNMLLMSVPENVWEQYTDEILYSLTNGAMEYFDERRIFNPYISFEKRSCPAGIENFNYQQALKRVIK